MGTRILALLVFLTSACAASPVSNWCAAYGDVGGTITGAQPEDSTDLVVEVLDEQLGDLRAETIALSGGETERFQEGARELVRLVTNVRTEIAIGNRSGHRRAMKAWVDGWEELEPGVDIPNCRDA